MVLSVDLGRGGGFGPHTHAVHQLAWSARGALSVTVEGDTWVLPPARALWIPAGFRHQIDATHGAAMRSPYFDPARCPVDFERPTVVGVGPLLRELIAHLAGDGVPEDARRRAEAVIFDLLEPVPATAIRLVLPADPRARTVATALLADPADPRSLEAWASVAAASPRTLARLFTRETGLGFRQWRTLLRIREALPLLTAGLPVAAVAHRVGYETPSAFVAAFHRELDMTPATFLRSPPHAKPAN